MDCVEGNKSRVSEEWRQFVADFDNDLLTPEVLLGELETAMEYIENLKHFHDEHKDFHEQD